MSLHAYRSFKQHIHYRISLNAKFLLVGLVATYRMESMVSLMKEKCSFLWLVLLSILCYETICLLSGAMKMVGYALMVLGIKGVKGVRGCTLSS